MTASDALHLDVAIVGGGVSGAYVAWRLTHASPDDAAMRALCGGKARAHIGVFEGSERIGGRLYSLLAPGMTKLHTEIGGMRFLHTQRLAAGVIDHLELPYRAFSKRTAGYYLRGCHLTEDDWRDPRKVPYQLAEDERGKTPGELFAHVMARICPQAMHATPAEWRTLHQTAIVDGVPLVELGFWNAVMRVASVEAYHLLYDGYGHETMIGPWNTADLLAMLSAHRGVEPEVRTLTGGMEQLPVQLVRRAEQAGASTFLRHRLVDAQPLALEGSDEDSGVELVFETPEGPRTVRARHVVFAMPRRSIERLHARTFLFDDPQFRDDLRSVAGVPASKLFLAYQTPWWQQAGFTDGCSCTDLPVRQCYYFGVEGDQPGADPSNRRALLLATYNDGHSLDYWRPYLSPSARAAQMHGAQARPLEASEAFIAEAHRQVRLMHGADVSVPDPYWSVFIDWTGEPYGGGWHAWLPGVRSDEVRRRMRQPRSDVHLYVVGEAWSAEQGWIEGALETSEAVLQDKLGLAPPPFAASGENRR